MIVVCSFVDSFSVLRFFDRFIVCLLYGQKEEEEKHLNDRYKHYTGKKKQDRPSWNGNGFSFLWLQLTQSE